MPQIKPFEAPQLGLTPTDRGIDAEASAGRLIGRFYNQAAESMSQAGRDIGGGIKAAGDAAVQYMEHQEINHGAAAYATLNDQLTQAWNNTAKSADPNDPTVADKFRETVLEPKLNEYRESFQTEGGQKFAEARIEALRNHMFEKTSADMSSLAADAVSVNMRTTANSLSNTAANDPSSVPHLLESADGLVGSMVDSSPNLKGAPASKARMELSERIKESIVKSGAMGAIAQAADPESEAAKWGQKYPQYISGDELKTLGANARSQLRARNYDYELNRRRDKEVATDKSTAKFNDYYIEAKGQDPRLVGDPTAKKILNDPDLLKSDKSNLLNLIDRQLKPETDARISAKTSTEIFRMMADPNADPAKIRQSLIDARAKDPGTPGSLSKSDFDDGMKNLDVIKTPDGRAFHSELDDFIKHHERTIDAQFGAYGLHSALGDQKIYALQKDAQRLAGQLKAKGQDPMSLFDQSSSNYIGKSLPKYMVSMQDAMEYDKSLDKAPKNLTGPGKDIVSVKTDDMSFKPPPTWQFSPSRGQYRDPATKQIYDLNGKPVK